MIPVSINEKTIFPILEESSNLKGISKNIYSETQNFPSLLILEKFKELTNIQGIALIGSSASGKSTLMKAIRLMSDDISIPKRFITRPQRLADDLSENIFISFDDFQNKIKNGELPISWMRKMEGDRIEYYGFEKSESKSFPIYSANNDFSRQIEIAKNALQDSKANNSELTEEQSSIYERIAFLSKTLLILGVYAPDEIRQKRLNERSPDLATSEREYRIKDSSDNIISHCHMLIKNYEETEKNALNDIVDLVKNVIKNRVKWGEIRDLGNHTIKHRSRLFDIVNHQVLFSDGAIKTFEYVERSPGVRTLITDGNSILVTKEWREELGGWDVRLPGGKMFENIKDYKNFKEETSDKNVFIQEARKAAHKETFEEVGLNLNRDQFAFEHISKCGAVINWDLYYFSIKIKEPISTESQIVTSENEMILNTWVSFSEIKEMCLNGQISEDRTSNFLLKYIHNSKK